MRVLVHAQHLSGAGHFVRMYEVARELAAHHAVTLVDGGRPVPRGVHAGRAEPTLLPLPRLVRGPGVGGLAAWDAQTPLATVLAERRRALEAHLDAAPPDVVVVEHYPFSKWEVGPELDALVAAARAVNPRVKVVASLRDLPGQTKHEAMPAEAYAARVLERQAAFDLVLVHGEAELTPLAASVPFAAQIPIPVVHTGMVGEPLRPDPAASAAILSLTDGAPFVLLSSGGGAARSDLAERVVAAWRALPRPAHAQDDLRLVVCGGLEAAGAEATRDDDGIVRLGFRADFLAWLAAAAASVSHAGYNTCANLVATAARALLVPHPRMSDQAPRAALFERLGLAAALPADADPAAIAHALGRVLAGPKPLPRVRLDGAARARDALERLAQGDRARP
ncbi:MAG: glycosyltransferase [Myxococcota bacterium]